MSADPTTRTATVHASARVDLLAGLLSLDYLRVQARGAAQDQTGATTIVTR